MSSPYSWPLSGHAGGCTCLLACLSSPWGVMLWAEMYSNLLGYRLNTRSWALLRGHWLARAGVQHWLLDCKEGSLCYPQSVLTISACRWVQRLLCLLVLPWL